MTESKVANNSTRLTTMGLSSYMLQYGVETLIPLSFKHSEFAARGIESKEEFVKHLSVKQQDLHELEGRNTDQAQFRQK